MASSIIRFVAILSIVQFHMQSIVAAADKREIRKILNWEAPEEYVKNYPYFLSGFDDDGLPVWIIEYGKWDVKKIFDQGKQAIKEFDKYTEQMLYRMHESPKEFSTLDNQVNEFLMVDDLNGYNNKQFMHVPSVTKALELFRKFYAIERKHGQRLKQGYGVNVNFMASTIWGMARPILGDLASKIEVFGTDEGKWKLALLRDIPKQALPPWLGGYSNHTAVHVFGKK